MSISNIKLAFKVIEYIKRLLLDDKYCDIRADTRIVEREETTVARQRQIKYVSFSTDKHKIEKLLEAMFSMSSVSRLYSKSHREKFTQLDKHQA